MWVYFQEGCAGFDTVCSVCLEFNISVNLMYVCVSICETVLYVWLCVCVCIHVCVCASQLDKSLFLADSTHLSLLCKVIISPLDK